MPRSLGVDGCRGGWVAAWKRAPGEPEVRLYRTLAALVDELTPAVLAIDIPVGLMDRGERACDALARARLGAGRASSVFPAPIRPILDAPSWDEANRIGRTVHGKGISKQAFALVPKISEVDSLLRRRPELRAVVWEVHPEVSFAELLGAPVLAPKKSRRGRDIRLDALRRLFDEEALDAARRAIPREDAGEDDVLDALVCLWTAERVDMGQAATMPALVPLDPVGIPMRIVY